MTYTVSENFWFAFENFWHDWILNHQDTDTWGPEYWQQFGFGVNVQDSQLVFDNEDNALLFILRWS